jgi:flotillin
MNLALVLEAGAVALVLALFFCSYRKVPKNRIGIRVGPFGNKTVTGKAIFVIPFLQRIDYMTLENIQVDFVSKDSIPTQDAINIKVDAVANIAISQEAEIMKKAAAKFIGYSTDDIASVVTPVLEGNIREIISQIKLKDLIQGDKKVLAEKVAENVKPNLMDLGLELTTFNIQNFKDDNGVINNLGIENTVSISKDAAKAKAAAEAEVKIAQALADKDANDARVAAELEIAQKQNELALKKASLKAMADTEAAKADAAMAIEAEVQRKDKEVKEVEANIARQEKEIELQEKRVSIKERALEAEVKKTAEADKYAAQQQADAGLYTRQKQAEAEAFEIQKQADAAAYTKLKQAEAEKLAMENEAAGKKALAEATKAQGEAEAAAIKAKLEAEAEGLNKKADAMAKYGDAAKQDMQLEALKLYFEQLPKIAEAAGNAYSNVDKIYMYGGDSSQLQGDIMKNVTQISEALGQSLGIDPKNLLNSFIGAKLANATGKDS